MRLHRVLLTAAVLCVVAGLAGCGSKPVVVYKTVTATPLVSATTDGTATGDSSPQHLELVESGWALAYGYVEYGVVLRNPNTAFAALFPTIDIEMLGKGGKLIAVTDQVLNMAMPGQTIAWGGQADPNAKKPTKVNFSLSVQESNWLSADSPQYEPYQPFKISGVSVGKDSLGSVVVTGRIKNPNADSFGSVAVSAILKGASGKVVAGFTGHVDNLGGHSSKSFQVSSLGELPLFKSVDVYAEPW